MMARDVVCANCGAAGEQAPAPGAREGPTDLDTRPRSMGPDLLPSFTQRCSSCGYCAPDISHPIALERQAETSEILGSARYQWHLNDAAVPSLARVFLCASLVQEATDDLEEAGWSAVHAAWACDDAGDDASAVRCRQRALDLLEAGWAGEPEEPVRAGLRDAIRADLLRRCGEFDRADLVCRIATADAAAYLRPCFVYQRVLIAEERTDAVAADEVATYLSTAPSDEIRDLAGISYGLVEIGRRVGTEALDHLAAIGVSGVEGATLIAGLLEGELGHRVQTPGGWRVSLRTTDGPSIVLALAADGAPLSVLAWHASSRRHEVAVTGYLEDGRCSLDDLLVAAPIKAGLPFGVRLADRTVRGIIADGDRLEGSIVAMPISGIGVWHDAAERRREVAGTPEAAFATEVFVPIGMVMRPGQDPQRQSNHVLLSGRVVEDRTVINPWTQARYHVVTVATSGDVTLDTVVPAAWLPDGAAPLRPGAIIKGVFGLVGSDLEVSVPIGDAYRTLTVAGRGITQPLADVLRADGTPGGGGSRLSGVPEDEARLHARIIIGVAAVMVVLGLLFGRGGSNRSQPTFRIPEFSIPVFSMPVFSMPPFVMPSVYRPSNAAPSGSGVPGGDPSPGGPEAPGSGD